MSKSGAEQGSTLADEIETARQGGYLTKILLGLGLALAVLGFGVAALFW